MEFFVICLIFIVCMIALALLIYYCQEKRNPKYGINENQRAITSIALSVGLPQYPNEDETNSKTPVAYNESTDLYLDDLSDSDSSEKMYYPKKSIAYSVARKMSTKAPSTPRRISITPSQAIEALEYFNRRRTSLPSPSQSQIITKNSGPTNPVTRKPMLQTRLSEEEEVSLSSVSTDSEKQVEDLKEVHKRQQVSQRKFSYDFTTMENIKEGELAIFTEKTLDELRELERRQLASKRKFSADLTSMESINEGVPADFSVKTRHNFRELSKKQLIAVKRKFSEDFVVLKPILGKRTSV